MVRVIRQHLAPEFGQFRGRGHTPGTVGFHHRPAIGFLVVGDPHLKHGNINIKQRTGEGERRAPLTGTGFRSEGTNACFPVVERLGNGGIGLVAARRAHAFVLVENLRRCAKRLLEPVSPV